VLVLVHTEGIVANATSVGNNLLLRIHLRLNGGGGLAIDSDLLHKTTASCLGCNQRVPSVETATVSAEP
jgi:hypothetical protein